MVLYIHKIVQKIYFLKEFFVLLQIFIDGNTNENEEEDIQETFFPKEEEIEPEVEKSFCPPQGMLNKIITNGM